MRAATCLVCGGDTNTPFLAVSGVPVLCNQLASTREAALAARRGDIDLVLCGDCGHVWNSAFEPGRMDYTSAYENSLHFSAHYRRYAEATARRLIDRYGLRGRTVFEIGCGRGDFLRLLCEKGDNKGVGCDPGGPASRSVPVEAGEMRIIGRPFAADLAPAADLVSCRHVLEHVPQPMHLLGTARRMLSRGVPGVAFFEVPNALFVFDRLSVWDIIYEHVSYFTPASLSRAFALAGYAVRHLEEAFGGQFLWVEAVPGQGDGPPPGIGLGDLRKAEACESFAHRYARIVGDWRLRLERHRGARHRVAVWGGGSKGTMFLNLLQVEAGGGIDYVVDINPRKRGRFVPGTGQEIADPAFLRGYRPDVLIVMNPEYRDEIAATAEGLGLDSELVVVSEAGTSAPAS